MTTEKTKQTKICSDCNHAFHRAGDCDHCNCGESEMVFSKTYLAMPGWWLAGAESNQLITS